jgi:AbrB family looped-hinge helix DNA binding protein
MPSASKIDSAYRMKVFPKGQVVIPVALRKKYQIEVGDQIEVIAEKDGILLKKSASRADRRTLTERLDGVFAVYANGKKAPTRKEVASATDSGFGEGWER